MKFRLKKTSAAFSLKQEMFPQEGENMLVFSHPAKSKIKPRIKDVDDSWDQLLSNCKQKKSRLQQAYQVQHAKTCVKTHCSLTINIRYTSILSLFQIWSEISSRIWGFCLPLLGFPIGVAVSALFG